MDRGDVTRATLVLGAERILVITVVILCYNEPDVKRRERQEIARTAQLLRWSRPDWARS